MKFELNLSVDLRNKLRNLSNSESISVYATAAEGRHQLIADNIIRELIPIILPVIKIGVDTDDDEYTITVKSRRKNDDTVIFDLDVKK